MNRKRVRVFTQKVKNLFWHFPKSVFYNLYFGFPSKKLTLIGITGTDGKTTTTTLIHQCLLESGINTGLISTLGAKIGTQEVKTGLHTTSPDPSVVQKILSEMVKSGITHVVIEVTAHAIDQFRFWGCHFQIAGITNTSHEHLDDFIDMDSYVLTKSKLLENCDNPILNLDDNSYHILKPRLLRSPTTYSINKKSDLQAKNIKYLPEILTFTVNKAVFSTDSLYEHQIYNILLTLAVLQKLNINPKILLQTIRNFPQIKGRREEVKNDLKVKCLVDFAHTPAALKSTLTSLKRITPGKLIVIFGATGGRDQTKRPLMGQIVSQIADIAVITADDTRLENVNDINRQIISGIETNQQSFTYHNVPNRQDAFNLAVKLSSPGDTIVACGKGHETTILHGRTEYPWSETDAFRTAFRQKKS